MYATPAVTAGTTGQVAPSLWLELVLYTPASPTLVCSNSLDIHMHAYLQTWCGSSHVQRDTHVHGCKLREPSYRIATCATYYERNCTCRHTSVPTCRPTYPPIYPPTQTTLPPTTCLATYAHLPNTHVHTCKCVCIDKETDK